MKPKTDKQMGKTTVKRQIPPLKIRWAIAKFWLNCAIDMLLGNFIIAGELKKVTLTYRITLRVVGNKIREVKI